MEMNNQVQPMQGDTKRCKQTVVYPVSLVSNFTNFKSLIYFRICCWHRVLLKLKSLSSNEFIFLVESWWAGEDHW